MAVIVVNASISAPNWRPVGTPRSATSRVARRKVKVCSVSSAPRCARARVFGAHEHQGHDRELEGLRRRRGPASAADTEGRQPEVTVDEAHAKRPLKTLPAMPITIGVRESPIAWRCWMSAASAQVDGAPSVTAARKSRANGTIDGIGAERAQDAAHVAAREHDRDAEHGAHEHAGPRVHEAVERSAFADRVRGADLDAAHDAEHHRVAEEHQRRGDADAAERARSEPADELRVDETDRGLAEHRCGDGPRERDELARRARRRPSRMCRSRTSGRPSSATLSRGS